MKINVNKYYYHFFINKLIFASIIFVTVSHCNILSQELKIGNQVWAERNLDVFVFNNGDTIPHADSSEEWVEAINNERPAWCYYNNDPENGEELGKLYNWYAVNDSRGLAPEGWTIPSVDDFKELVKYYGDFREEIVESDLVYYKKQFKKLKRKFKRTKNDSLFVTKHDDYYDSSKVVRKILPAEADKIIMFENKIPQSTINEIENSDVGEIIGPVITENRITIVKVVDIKETDYATVRHIFLSNRDEQNIPTVKAKADSILQVIKEKDNFEEMVALYSEDFASNENGGVYSDFTRGEMIPKFNDFVFDHPEGSMGVVSSMNGVHIVEVLHKHTETRPEIIYIRKEMRQGSSAATRMKHKKKWDFYPRHGNSKNSFKAHPAGYRLIDGVFAGKGTHTIFWTNSKTDDNAFIYLGLMSRYDVVIANPTNKPEGFSVRCIKK